MVKVKVIRLKNEIFSLWPEGPLFELHSTNARINWDSKNAFPWGVRRPILLVFITKGGRTSPFLSFLILIQSNWYSQFECGIGKLKMANFAHLWWWKLLIWSLLPARPWRNALWWWQWVQQIQFLRPLQISGCRLFQSFGLGFLCYKWH